MTTSATHNTSTRATQASHSAQRFTQLPVWSAPFRPFFLCAAMHALLSVVLWALYLNGSPYSLGFKQLWPSVWHSHEMIFAFGGLCAMGFLLTAVQNWTGLRSAYGASLAGLSLLWLCARLALWFEWALAAMLLQGLWWLSCISLFSALVIRARSRRNYQFIPILLILSALDITTLALGFSGDGSLALHLSKTALLLFVVLISIVGGRIIPLFTRNATGSTKINSSPHFDLCVLILSLCCALLFLLSKIIATESSQFGSILGLLLAVTGLAHFIRLSRWDSRSTRNNAMLWSMHLSYLMVALGLINMGLSYFSPTIQLSNAIHLIAIGAMGGMILSVIARVALGHSGRQIKADKALATAFALVALAAIVRSLLPSIGWHLESWNISALLWCLAFGIYLLRFTPILTRPRH